MLEMGDEVPKCTEQVHHIPWGIQEGKARQGKDTVKWETRQVSMAGLRTQGWRLGYTGVLSSESRVKTSLNTWQLQRSRFKFWLCHLQPFNTWDQSTNLFCTYFVWQAWWQSAPSKALIKSKWENCRENLNTKQILKQGENRQRNHKQKTLRDYAY